MSDQEIPWRFELKAAGVEEPLFSTEGATTADLYRNLDEVENAFYDLIQGHDEIVLFLSGESEGAPKEESWSETDEDMALQRLRMIRVILEFGWKPRRPGRRR